MNRVYRLVLVNMPMEPYHGRALWAGHDGTAEHTNPHGRGESRSCDDSARAMIIRDPVRCYADSTAAHAASGKSGDSKAGEAIDLAGEQVRFQPRSNTSCTTVECLRAPTSTTEVATEPACVKGCVYSRIRSDGRAASRQAARTETTEGRKPKQFPNDDYHPINFKC